MWTNALPSELVAVAAAVDPDAYGAGAVSSGYVDLSDYPQVMAIALAGTIAGSGTVDMKLQSNTAATGGSDVSGKAITQLTQAGGDSDKQAIVNLRGEEVTEGHRYVKAVQTVGTGADAATMILGAKAGMVGNALMSELIGVCGVVDPDANAPGALSTDWVDMADWHMALAVVLAGDLGADTTLAAKLEQATSSAGAGAKDITGKSITTLDQTDSPNPSNSQVTIDLRAEDLDVENGFRYARLTMTGVDTANSPETTASDFAGVLLGFIPRNGVATAHDLASVDEVVS